MKKEINPDGNKVTKKSTKVIQAYNEQEAKEFILKIFNKMQVRVEPNLPKHVFYDVDGNTMFELDYQYGYLWVSYIYIWFYLETKYSMEYSEVIERYIKHLVKEILYWKGLKPKDSNVKCFVPGAEHNYWKKTKSKQNPAPAGCR